MRLELDTLRQTLPDARVSLPVDSCSKGRFPIDLLLQVEDYEVCLKLLEAPEGRPALSPDEVGPMLEAMEEHPNAVALVLVWATENLLSIPFSLRRLSSLEQGERRLANLLARARPLAEVLTEVIERQSRRWVEEVEIRHGPPQGVVDLKSEFGRQLEAAIKEERARPYTRWERKLAALRYPQDVERELIAAALDEAMLGSRQDLLVGLLSRLPGDQDQ